MAEWKRGLPRGKYYPGMEDDFEVAFAPLEKWHRRRSPEDAFVNASRRALEYGKALCIHIGDGDG